MFTFLLSHRKVGPTQNDDFRSPKVKLLYGDSTWVTKKENRVLYSWDLSKCMFSSGNITEKRRIATWYLRGKVVVDLYSGIGYFTLTYLVHSKADFVYACEWNPDAVQALEANIKLNNISMDRYQILEGDNRLTCPKNVCDHVNLGLIPSSEASWRTACAALKKSTGGVLHIHGNVDTKGPGSGVTSTSGNNFYSAIKFPTKTDYHVEWSKYVCCAIQKIFGVLYPNETWEVNIDAVIKIKSFAPHVDHLVTDITCKPILSK